MKRLFKNYFRRLSEHFGPTGWWPGDSAFEIAVGAILVQNTGWVNVEQAIANLKESRLLNPRRILEADPSEVESILRPAGCFRVKTKRLRSFCDFLADEFGGSMARMARVPLEELRPRLLDVHGIGPETADDILLYACHKPVFVVDAYTRRVLSRHGVVDGGIGYESLRAIFETNLAENVTVFQEFHALLVRVGHDYCRKTPKCSRCPLEPTLKAGQPLIG